MMLPGAPNPPQWSPIETDLRTILAHAHPIGLVSWSDGGLGSEIPLKLISIRLLARPIGLASWSDGGSKPKPNRIKPVQ